MGQGRLFPHAADKPITLRAVTAGDEAFLFDVYAGTRREEIAGFGWDEVQQNAFLKMQFDIRERAYKMQYPFAANSVILLDGVPAGRLMVERLARRIVLTDIAVLPGFRNNAIATRLIKQLQDEAAAAGLPLVLHVDRANGRARRLYDKLGFSVISEAELTTEMQWMAAPG